MVSGGELYMKFGDWFFFSMILEISLYFKNSFDWREGGFF